MEFCKRELEYMKEEEEFELFFILFKIYFIDLFFILIKNFFKNLIE